MKKHLLFFPIILILLFSAGAWSQSIGLSWSEGTIQNGDIIDVSGSPDTVIYVAIKIHNKSTSTIDVKVRKQDILMLSGTMDTYCLSNQCYGGEIPVSPDSVQILPGGYDTTFKGEYYPLGVTGVSTIRYTFFNTQDTDDTITVTVRYSGSASVAKTNISPTEISNAYPNPASDVIYFDYNNSESTLNSYIIIRDFAGRIVREVVIPQHEGVLEIDLTDIETGVYFYSLMQNNLMLLTKKLIVKR